MFPRFFFLVVTIAVALASTEFDVFNEDLVWISANTTANFSGLVSVGNSTPPNFTSPFVMVEDPSIMVGSYTLGDLLTGFLTSANISWTFVTHITIAPSSCSAVGKIVSDFNYALTDANPGVNDITSFPKKLGSALCVKGVCPCADKKLRRRYYQTRVLEVETKSRSKKLFQPAGFPFVTNMVSVIG